MKVDLTPDDNIIDGLSVNVLLVVSLRLISATITTLIVLVGLKHPLVHIVFLNADTNFTHEVKLKAAMVSFVKVAM